MSNECKKDPSDCRGVPLVNEPIEDLSFTVTSKFKDRAVRINALHSSDSSFATLFEFAPNILKVGWNISLSTPTTSVRRLPDGGKKRCGENQKEKEFLSPVVELSVLDEEGRLVRHFDVPLKISTFANPLGGDDSSLSGVCFGYNEGGEGADWKCADEFSVSPTKTDQVSFVATQSDHLTSFAVLLGPTRDSSCDLDWISIASLVLIGSSMCLVLFIGSVYLRHRRFQALVGGYNANKRITAIQEKLAQS